VSGDRNALRAAQAEIRGLHADGDRLTNLCQPCLSVLPVTGASVSALSGPMNNDTVCASDDIAFRIDELQLDLGEGPCWEAFASRRPVLVPDVRAGPHAEWPVFGEAVQQTPAQALFAFPLYVGWTGVGALDLYCTTPGELDDGALHDAAALAATIATELLRRILDSNDRSGPGNDVWHDWPQDRRQVHQATGMLIDQLDLPVGAAFARLRAHAFATGATVADLARDVVSGRLRFAPERQ
jgi:GAF domain-containing protein